MKRISYVCLALYFCLIAGPSPASDDADDAKERTISVSASHAEEFPPDTVSLSIAVESASRKATEASASAAKKAEALLTEIKKIIDKDDSIKTSSYSLTPVYEYDNMRKRDFVAGYRAVNEVTVRTKKTGLAGEIIDAGIKAGAGNIGNVVFSISDYTKHCDSLIASASKKAEALAESAAKAFGLKITGVKRLTPSCSTELAPVFAQEMRAFKSADAARTPVEPGTSKVYGAIGAEFYVAP